MVKTASDSLAPTPQGRYFSSGDLGWMLVVVALVLLNLFISLNDYLQARQTESTRAHAQSVLGLMLRMHEARASAKPGSEACQPDSKWSDCQEALLRTDAASAMIKNVLRPGNPVFSNACDRQRPGTLGSIVIEVGTAKTSDPESLTYAPIRDDQLIGQRLPLRVGVCGRLYSKMLTGQVVL